MLRLVNRYCSNCLRTQRFVDLDAHLVCVCCTKRLERVRPSTVTVSLPRNADGAIVTWAERRKLRRDAG